MVKDIIYLLCALGTLVIFMTGLYIISSFKDNIFLLLLATFTIFTTIILFNWLVDIIVLQLEMSRKRHDCGRVLVVKNILFRNNKEGVVVKYCKACNGLISHEIKSY